MERVRRRYWTWAITAGAVLVILAAAASSLFQLAVQTVPGYRSQVEQYVRQVTGRPVRIGALGLTWHYYYPSLDLIDVALLADDGATVVLQAERLRLGFSLLRLVSGDYVPNRLELSGLAVDARIDGDGHVQVKGIDAGQTQGAPAEVLRPLTQFAQLRVERCRLNLRDDRATGETYSFGIVEAELDRGLLSDALDAEVALPSSIGETARFEGSVTGEPLDPETWSGSGTLDLVGLTAGNWIKPYLVRGANLEVSGVEARLRGTLEKGRVTHVDLALHTGAIRGLRARHEAALESLEANVAVEFLADGWNAELKRLVPQTPRGSWPHAKGSLRATRAPDGPVAYDAQLSYADVATLAPWLQIFAVPAGLAQLDQATGVVHDLQLHLQGRGDDARYTYRATFENVGLPADERAAGFAGVKGEAAGDETGGRAVLQEGPLTLDLPGILVSPNVQMESFEGEVEWRPEDAGWRLKLPQFRWELLGIRGNGHLDLLLPQDRERSPEIDLGAHFSTDDATRAKALMPLHWGSGLRNWLDRSIVAARVPGADLVIKGPLADFPYQKQPTGVFSLDIEAKDVLLAYQPDWPEISDIDAKLEFRGNTLSIDATRGTVSGNPIQHATARFPDFHTGQLLIDGSVAGETAKMYDFLANSPLREKFRGLLTQTTASGPATVDVHLDLPVSNPQDTRVSGRVVANGAELKVHALPEPIKDIRGQIGFTGAGISGDKITGRLYEVPLEGALAPQSADTTLLTAGFRLAVDPAGKGASELIPAWIRKRVAGASRWRAEYVIGGKLAAPVKLTTDLVGVEVKYPPPVGKPADQAQSLTLSIGSPADAALQIVADYQDRFGADLRFARVNDALTLKRASLRAGAGTTAPADEDGIVLRGDVPELDARAWDETLFGRGADKQVQGLRRADLHVGRAVWDRWALRDARCQWVAQPDGWTLVATGPGASGAVQWLGAEHGTLSTKLDAMALEYLPPPAEEPAELSVLDPNQLPLYDLDVQRLTVNQANFGHVVLATARTDLGQKVRKLKVDGGIVALSGDADWRHRSGQSSGSLNADFTTTDIAGVLRAFGYTPNLDAKNAHVTTAVTWAPSDRGIEWQQAQGTVHLEFANGQLRAVEPGAGRVLGLVNFYALPRRLTLNFRDVLGSGLGFDSITGDFELREGNARTQNLHIAGPSLRMDLNGRVGLAARDYDQQVSVYPDVSSGVTLGALALGGPVAGGLAWIAQTLLKKPLNQVTELNYRITGSWDNPQVEHAAPKGPTPAPAPTQTPTPSPAPTKKP